MKVILKADVKGTGKKGDIIEVSDGFAKNFLFKRKLAELATSSGINEVRQKKTSDEFHRAENVKALKELAARLNDVGVTVAIRTGENGRLFGSVTTAHIAAALEKEGYEIDKKRITLKEPIKNVGTYTAEIRLMEGVVSAIKVNVVAV